MLQEPRQVLRGKYEKKSITLGTLFDGIGGFPLAAVNNGITPVWASEIRIMKEMRAEYKRKSGTTYAIRPRFKTGLLRKILEQNMNKDQYRGMTFSKKLHNIII